MRAQNQIDADNPFATATRRLTDEVSFSDAGDTDDNDQVLRTMPTSPSLTQEKTQTAPPSTPYYPTSPVSDDAEPALGPVPAKVSKTTGKRNRFIDDLKYVLFVDKFGRAGVIILILAAIVSLLVNV